MANGDHVYWDQLAPVGRRAYTSPEAEKLSGTFDRSATVLGSDNDLAVCAAEVGADHFVVAIGDNATRGAVQLSLTRHGSGVRLAIGSAREPDSLHPWLASSVAALDLLGPAYTWSTPVYMEGAVREGTLYGLSGL